MFEEYFDKKYKNSDSIKTYEELVNAVDAKKMTLSKFVKSRVAVAEMPEQSNGESALMHFASVIKEDGLYILDEPENSMSASTQIKLAQFLEDSARFFNCQFIIATHSPFLLNIKDAKIYDLDSYPARVKKWSDLENVRVYYEFFAKNSQDFAKNKKIHKNNTFITYFFQKCVIILLWRRGVRRFSEQTGINLSFLKYVRY